MVRESCLVGTPAIYTGKRDMLVNREFIKKSCMFKVNNINDLNIIIKKIIENDIRKILNIPLKEPLNLNG